MSPRRRSAEVVVRGPGQSSSDARDVQAIPGKIPVLGVRDSVLFPNLAMPVFVGKPSSLKLIEDVAAGNRLLATALVIPGENTDDESPPDPAKLHTIGTLARIAELLRLPSGDIQVGLQGIARVSFEEWVSRKPYLISKISVLEEPGPSEGAEARMRSVLAVFRNVAELAPYIPQPFAIAAMNIRDPADLADFLAANLNVSTADKQSLLERLEPEARLAELESLLKNELHLLELSTQAHQELSEDVAKMQREQFLRRQLEVIRRELGEAEDSSGSGDLRQRVNASAMSEDARAAAERELGRLDRMLRGSPEETVARTYVEWLIEMPWTKTSEDQQDLVHAREVLDADHYGLEEVKDRILEYLAVSSLRPDRRSPILCFVGPPGVGKTSLGQSIARALGRQFVRMSLGGIRDEAEIRGHRRTYIGALPGRIVQSLRRAGTANPVMMLDEIDKLGIDFRGDPSSALLEVLDPAQNSTFSDHYLEVAVDLSRVMFICTANLMDPIHPALRDRLEIIELRGYTEMEKVQIARRHLLPRQLSEHGLKTRQAAITDDSLRRLAREYTFESGVRNLERQIASVLRKVARKVAEGKAVKKVSIKPPDLDELLGPPLTHPDHLPTGNEVGVATGLAWTPMGGRILSVEAMLVSGKGSFTLTGQLGDVMRESARAGLTYARSRASAIGAAPKWFEEYEVHVHVPAGAVPKDGPSAGITMTTAMVSAITRIPVRRRVAMTGEITLRGKVLPVGGIKEKVIAGHRAGIKTIILPKDNERDLREVPDAVRNQLKFVLVEHMDEVLKEALSKPLRALELSRDERAS